MRDHSAWRSRFWTVRCMIVVCLNFQRPRGSDTVCKAGFWFPRWNMLQRMNGAVETEADSAQSEAEITVFLITEQGDDWWASLLTSYLDKRRPNLKEERELIWKILNWRKPACNRSRSWSCFCRGVVSGVFGDICRAKGYLPAGNGWLRFDVTDRTYSASVLIRCRKQKLFYWKTIKKKLASWSAAKRIICRSIKTGDPSDAETKQGIKGGEIWIRSLTLLNCIQIQYKSPRRELVQIP